MQTTITDSLYEAQTKLKKATDWGLFDIFGGDTFSGIMKHGRMNEAKQCIEAAKVGTYGVFTVTNYSIKAIGFYALLDIVFKTM